MREANSARSPSRGRPPTDIERHVIKDLMQAAEVVLEGKTIKETTIREIAAAAGTNEAMINYYFGGKEGLMIALFQETLKNHPKVRATQISAACIAARSIRPLIKELIIHYNVRPSLIRMSIAEMISGSSEVKALYNEKYAKDTPTFICRILEDMIEAKIYQRDLSLEFITMSIMGMMVAPNFLVPVARVLHMSGKLDSAEWIDHVTRTIDLSTRIPAH
jgi:AcrR family transcriptional regulator